MEIWKEIKDFPGYSVSNTGKIKSHNRIVLRNGHEMKLKGKVMKPGRLKRREHRYVNLRRDGKHHSQYVHRLVALAFIGPQPDGKTHVAHWDGDASNNHVNNLRWATPAENSQDSIRLGRSRRPTGTRSGKGKLTHGDISLIYDAYLCGASMREIAKEMDVSHGVISSLLRQKSYREDCQLLDIQPVR